MKNNKLYNLAQLFIASAIKFPDKYALNINNKKITYYDLLCRSNYLAQILSQYTGTVCALLNSRSTNAYSGLLAILMSGKICVPLTIKNPAARNAEMLKFSEADIILVDEISAPFIFEILKYIDKPLHVILTSPCEIPKAGMLWQHNFIYISNKSTPYFKVKPSQNAYLLYTSGSTGTPKAVMTTHQSVIQFIQALHSQYQTDEKDSFTQMTEFTFDAAMMELFLCWIGGSCLYTITEHHLTSLEHFIDHNKITVWSSVPALIGLLKKFNRLKPNQFPSLRYSLLFGEPLTEDIAETWHAIAPYSYIDNLYGPTEATIVFTVYRWQREQKHPSGYVPIGMPLPGQHIAILDESYNPISPGATGELYLSGPQVAQGYWKNPQKTQESFVILPNDPTTIWYRTGDFVCWEEPWGLIYKSRASDQFKIRGARVDKLEVENILKTAANTPLAAVVQTQLKDGSHQHLIGFISQSPSDDFTILKYCQEKLPDYMVPNKIIKLEQFPLTQNGKTNYQYLKEIACCL